MNFIYPCLVAFSLAAALISPTHGVEKPTGTFSSSGAVSDNLYDNPNLRGVLIHATWAQIEPTPGNFNFSAIDAQASVAEVHGKSWSLAIPSGGTGSPDWLTEPTTNGGLGAPFINYSFRGIPGYKLPLYWSSIVQDRIALLADTLAAQYNNNRNLKLVYVTQMTANGNEGHLQGIDMATLIAAGNDRDGDSDVDAADFQINWIEASEQAARSYAQAFTTKAIAFEVHEVNGSSIIPETIINNLWNDPALEQRVGAAMWWISGKTSYQSDLLTVLTNFPGDIYGQVIGKSSEPAWQANSSYSRSTFRMPTNRPPINRLRYEVTTAGTSGSTEPSWPTTIGATVTDGTVTWTCRNSRFENGDYTTVFSQAKTIGIRYIEPWEWEFKSVALSANGEWDAILADFNAWAEGTFAEGAPTITAIADQTTAVDLAVGPLDFTVGDAETTPENLTVTAQSSNPILLPALNITIGGSDANRTVTLNPANGQTGVSTVTLTVSDGILSTQTTFTLTVTTSSSLQTVTALHALHQHGQTYLTWNEISAPSATYHIYRSTTPFTHTDQLSNENRIGTAVAESSFDSRLSDLRNTDFFYRISPSGPDLTSAQGLYVVTPTSDGVAYYAVTALIGGGEQVALDEGQSTTGSVIESVARPEPIFQRSTTVNGRIVEIYVHWVSATTTPDYPAMGNTDSVAHHLGLVKKGNASTHSLLIRPHARNGSFLSTVTGTNDPDEWVLTLDDWMPNTITNTFWYGYHELFEIDTGQPQATRGIVHDFTAVRAQWEIEWALRSLPLDLNRIYMAGHSMGGIGSHFLSQLMPDQIAAIWTTSPKYDFSFLTDPNPINFWNDGAHERSSSGDIMWGMVSTDLICNDGIPVYDRLNLGHLLSTQRRIDQPVMISFHGKNDFVVGWAEKLGFYSAMNDQQHGGLFFFDSGAHNRSGAEWLPQQRLNDLNRYRLDQSYPAFSNSTANGDPGTGSAASGDTFGTLNGNLDWDTSSIIDTPDRWQMRVFTTALTSSGGPIEAPSSAVVNLTPRRFQVFPHRPGSLARYEVRNSSHIVTQQGLLTADADALFTLPTVTLTPDGTTVTLLSVAGDAPSSSVVGDNIHLTWSTTPGVSYQVEWSPDLSQWFPIGSPIIATGNTMTWTDDGTETAETPEQEARRFYRLRMF